MDELQALNKLYSSPEPPPKEVVQRQREILMNTIAAATTPDPQIPSRSRRRRVITLVAVPVAALSLAAAGWRVLHDEPSQTSSYACLADGVVAVLPNNGTNPIKACRTAWEDGAMVAGVTKAPPLTACIHSGGQVAVIEAKTTDACEVAGMEEWGGQADFETVGAAIRAVLVQFHDRFAATGNGCATEQEWRDALKGQPGMEEWTIDADQIEPNRRCYDVGDINPGDFTITLIGSPGDYSIGCDPRTGC